jgi:hypothetical protein
MSYLIGMGWVSLITEYSALIGAFLTGVAGPVIVAYVRHKLNKKNIELEKRKKEFVHTIETQEIVNESLNKLQSEYDLDRIWLAQFHNGGNYYPGNKCMKKMSVSFESTAPGISTDMMRMQNLPVSFFSGALQKLSSGQESFIIDADTEEDQALKSFWANRGIHSVYLFPIISINKDFIGILGVDFIKKEGFMSEEVFNRFKREAHILSGYIALLTIEDLHK